jgi:hypothetical protein
LELLGSLPKFLEGLASQIRIGTYLHLQQILQGSNQLDPDTGLASGLTTGLAFHLSFCLAFFEGGLDSSVLIEFPFQSSIVVSALVRRS